jgi:hypothetical protein
MPRVFGAEEVSPYYLEALPTYEDRWFYRHPGGTIRWRCCVRLGRTSAAARVVGWQHLFVKVLPEGKGAMRQYFDKWMLLCRYSGDLFLAKGPGRAMGTQHWRSSNELKPKWGVGWLSLYRAPMRRRWFFCRLLLLPCFGPPTACSRCSCPVMIWMA